MEEWVTVDVRWKMIAFLLMQSQAMALDSDVRNRNASYSCNRSSSPAGSCCSGNAVVDAFQGELSHADRRCKICGAPRFGLTPPQGIAWPLCTQQIIHKRRDA
jgi:hypothetical protein